MINYTIQRIDNSVANNYQKERHYLKRKSQAMFSFGLFNDLDLIGVCIFGIPASVSLCKGIAGIEYKNKVLELNRLYIIDNTPKNTESWFVSKCLKLLKQHTDKFIIVSYADTSQNHVGTIYQALSFLYTGITKPRRDRYVKNDSSHGRNTYRYKTLKELQEMGIEMDWKIRPQKHRYIKFNCGKLQRKNMLKLLKYQVQAYPQKKE